MTYCARVGKVPILDRTTLEIKTVLQPHLVREEDASIECTECKTIWCCTECCVEDDSMDKKTFFRIYKKSTTENRKIICCKCSGNKPSWMS